MKKSAIALLMIVSALMLLCAGCGGTENPSAAVSATMAPTAEPEVTAEPTEVTAEPVEETAEPAAEDGEEAEPAEEADANEESSQTSGNSNSNSSNNSGNSNSSSTTDKSETVDKYKVASTMTGSSVSELYEAIGKPNGTEYTASCLIPTGEDGLLYYDDFTVSTIRYSDGTELVMGAF